MNKITMTQPSQRPVFLITDIETLELADDIIVLFYALGCVHCERLINTCWLGLKTRFPKTLRVMINVDDEPITFNKFKNGDGVPQIMRLQKGKVVKQTKGNQPCDILHEALEI